jgi:hypothetical protein
MLRVEWIYVGVPHHETALPSGNIRDRRHEIRDEKECLLGEDMLLPVILRRFLAQERAEHGGREVEV